MVCDDECTFDDSDPCAGAAVVYDGPLSLELKAGMNRLDGFINSAPATMPFSKALDPETLTEDSVMVFDILPYFTRGIPPGLLPAGAQKDDAEKFGEGYWRILSSAGGKHMLTLKHKAPKSIPDGGDGMPATWPAGGKFAVAVTNSVRGVDGTPVESDLLLYLLRGKKPLVDIAKRKALSFLLQAQIDAGAMTFEDAIALESLRGVYSNLLNAIEQEYSVPRKDVPLFYLFGIAGNAVPSFGPSVGLSLAFPRELNPWPNEFLGTEDPVPADTVVEILFDTPPVDTLLGKDPTIQLYDITGATPAREACNLQWVPGDTSKVELRYGPDDGVKRLFESGHRYAVVVTTATLSVAFPEIAGSTYWGLVSAENPLVDARGNLESVLLDQRLDVLVLLNSQGMASRPPEATQAEWDTAASMLEGLVADLEQVRQRMDPLLDMLEQADPTLARENLALAFTFTVE